MDPHQSSPDKQSASPSYYYLPNAILPYPLTLVASPYASTKSKPIPRPFSFEVHCPLACTNVKIGAALDSRSELTEFTTTSSRCVSCEVGSELKYLVNEHPPTKKTKKVLDTQGPWSICVQVKDKGNFAIINPFSQTLGNPLSFYTFHHKEIDHVDFNVLEIEQMFVEDIPRQMMLEQIVIGGSKLYLHRGEKVTLISHNTYFDDDLTKSVTIQHPISSKILRMNPKELKALLVKHQSYWLSYLAEQIAAETFSPSNCKQIYNLDKIYKHLGNILIIDEQLRARLHNNVGKQLLQELYKYHPRLYSSFSRLNSFINYGCTKYSTIALAENGFYNKSDMLQDLAYIEYPTVPIPTCEQAQHQSELELRQSCFPMGRLARGLPFPNVPLTTFVNSLHYQTIDPDSSLKYYVEKQYLLAYSKTKLSLWGSKVMLLKLIELDLLDDTRMTPSDTKIVLAPVQAQSKSVDEIGNLFDDPKEAQKVPPAEIVADQALLEHMLTMGYTLTVARKALIAVKNESVQAAIDAADQIREQEKKKLGEKKIKKVEWSCVSCTFYNKATAEMCEMCGQPPQIIDEEEQRKRQEKQLMEIAKMQAQQLKREMQQKALADKQAEEERINQSKLEEQNRIQQNSKLMEIIEAKLSYCSQAPLDPFFVVLLIRHTGNLKYQLRVVRIGYHRVHLQKLYRIEGESLISNISRKIYTKSHAAIVQLAHEAQNAMEWGLKMLQPTENDWAVTQVVLADLEESFCSVTVSGLLVEVMGETGTQTFQIQLNDKLEGSSFQLVKVDKSSLPEPVKPDLNTQKESQTKQQPSFVVVREINISQKLLIDEAVSQIRVEITQHIPAGEWQRPQIPKSLVNSQPDKENHQRQLIFHDCLPLALQHYEGSMFSHKHYPTAVFDRNNYYISNYPAVNFTFKSNAGVNMLIDSVIIVPAAKKLSKVYPVYQGLLFTANQIAWFHIAKEKYAGWSEQDYHTWLKGKNKCERREFWEPVAFFKVEGEKAIQLQYKRFAKYIFLLPTNLKNVSNKKEDYTVLQLDFFAVKGRLQIPNRKEESVASQTNALQIYKNEGETQCQIKFTHADKPEQTIDSSQIAVTRYTNINTMSFLQRNGECLSKIPLSITTCFQIKLRDRNYRKLLKIRTQFASKAKVSMNCQPIPVLAVQSIKSYKELAEMQDELNGQSLRAIASQLNIKELVLLILEQDATTNIYETLVQKIQQAISLNLFTTLCEILPQLSKAQITVTQLGLKHFLSLLDRHSHRDLNLHFLSVTDTMKQLTTYVSTNRSKNYNLLRNNYAVQDLVLEPYLFSKQYYRMVHANYVQEAAKPNLLAEPQGPANNTMFVEHLTPFAFVAYLDLTTVKEVHNITLYFPKLSNISTNLKTIIKISTLDDGGCQQVYYRYFNDDFLMHMCVYSYHNGEIYSEQTNCFVIANLDCHSRYFKIEINYSPIVIVPMIKYKAAPEPIVPLALVDSSPSQTTKQSSSTESYLNKRFPTQARRVCTSEKMPPTKCSIEGPKAIYNVYSFPHSQPEVIKKEFSEQIERLTTNILDKAIVEQCIASMKINQYEFGRKGIDFAYTLMMVMLNSSKKFPEESQIPVELLLGLFDTFVVFQIGPIMKRVMQLLQQSYKRLTKQQQSDFVGQIIHKYLEQAAVGETKLSEKYSISKILDNLKLIELPLGLLSLQLSKTNSKLMKVVLMKLLLHQIKTIGITHLQVYDLQTGKYLMELTLLELITMALENCLWVLENILNIKQQVVEEALDLLLLFLGKCDVVSCQYITINLPKALTSFMETLKEVTVWKLLFKTLALKSELFTPKINALFGVLIHNATPAFLGSVNSMLDQIITKKPNSIYLEVNNKSDLSDQQWMSHLQTVLELIRMTDKEGCVDLQVALRLLELPLTPTLWSSVLRIIPKDDKVLVSIIRHFNIDYYSSLGQQITNFCQPLAGIRSIESPHINWLELVRKIRLQNKSIFKLFIEQLDKASFGGRTGLSMATPANLKQLDIAVQFSKLVLQKPTDLNCGDFTKQSISVLMQWYFMNKTVEKGTTPASDKLLILSQNIKELFVKMSQLDIIQLCIDTLIEVKKSTFIIQQMFEKKMLPIHTTLMLNRRFCECYEELFHLFVTNDQLSTYFAFKGKGLEYLLRTIEIEEPVGLAVSVKSSPGVSSPEEEFLVKEGLITTKISRDVVCTDIKELEDLKEEQFANNVKLMEGLNTNLVASVTDWTSNKKGNKSKILFIPLGDGTQNQQMIHIQLAKTIEIRSIKMGFTAASYEISNKLVATPSAVLVDGGSQPHHFEPLGEMSYLPDDGYICNGVQLFVLNFQQIKSLQPQDCLDEIQLHKVKYLRITVKKPLVTFLEGQYSPLNGKPYNNLGCYLAFLSVTGDDAQKMPFGLIESCKQITKKSSISIMGCLLNESNPSTMSKIAMDSTVSGLFQRNFKRVQEYLNKYKTMPNIVYSLGAGNAQFGDWILYYFLKEKIGEIQSSIVNQIITSNSLLAFERLKKFQLILLQRIAIINHQSQIESGLLFLQEVHAMQSFCKTLEECYDLGLKKTSEKDLCLTVSMEDVNNIIGLYDTKYTSQQSKTLIKLLVNLLYLRAPLSLSEDILLPTINLVWQNCSQAKAYFYVLMGALLIYRKAKEWVRSDDYAKIKILLSEVNKSITSNSQKTLKLQLSLLSQIAYHEGQFFRKNKIYLQLYNQLKMLIVSDLEIYDMLLRIIRIVVIGSPDQEKTIAAQLVADAQLLIKRKDPMLQKLYVGILGLESEVMIHISGVDFKKEKKDRFPTKYITVKQKEWLNLMIGKKYSFKLIGDISETIDPQHQETFHRTFTSSAFLMVLRFKVNDKLYTCGAYCSTSSKKSQKQEQNCKQQINYSESNFLFLLGQSEPFLIRNTAQKRMIEYAVEQDFNDNLVSFFDEDTEIFHMEFKGSGGDTAFNVPILNFKKYPNEFSNLQTYMNSANDSYHFVGIELWQLGQVQLSITESKRNSLSKNQAKSPFNICRHNPIYIFPAKITVKKFLQMLGTTGSCKFKNVEVNSQEVLANLEVHSADFIIDLDISSHQQEEKQGQIGYIPIMNIFNHFSEMEGVTMVLKLGSESIKHWSNATRQKSFQLYLQELKSFIPLPNFFSLFIKEQSYVMFLFEVASGLPDDSSSTRNWEEEYVNSFRYIYKIVSDIFKFDRAPELRNMNKYSEFLEVILEKLAEITKETVRVLKEDEPTQAQSEVPTKLQAKISSEQHKPRRKKAGTGYGADNQNSSKWSANEWLEKRKNVSQQTLRVTTILVSFFDCSQLLTDAKIGQLVMESCLLPLIQSSLRSGSLLDISKEFELFKTYLLLIRLLATNPATIACILDLSKQYKPEQTESVYSLLGKLNSIAAIFTECLKSDKGSTETNQTAEDVSLDIQSTYDFVQKAIKKMRKYKKTTTIQEINSMSIDKAYRYLLSDLRFGYINLKDGSGYRHALNSSITDNNTTAKILRLSQQLADLSSSLPCQHTNSIFVRCDRERIDIITVLIMGSKDTPYSNGAFTFDVYCDKSYPNNPPKMLITTTGQGKIRFNPNLYSCGKVCLSLLGTWRGAQNENWDPKVSTLLQLFISTQGITMSDDIYFNEPGFEGQQGTQQGDKKNQAYSNIVRLGNIRYAMIQQIKNPPKGFEEIIHRHFYIKKEQILQQCQKWLQYADKRQASYSGLVNDHNTTWCTQLKATKNKYKQLLQVEVDQLRELLNNLPAPNLEQKIQEQPEVIKKKHKQVHAAQEVDLKEVDVGYDMSAQETKEYAENVIQDRWSRYIGAMGIEAVKKQAESSVLLLGFKPLGLQIAKNLILSGLKRLTIVENDEYNSPSQHFYLSNMKSNRLYESIFKLKELNPYMLVDHRQIIPDLNGYSLVISTLDYYKSVEISQRCHTEQIKFIYAESCGVYGNYFADFGENFAINDSNGEQPFQGMIKNISEDGVVTLLDGIKHPYEDGDYIVLQKVEGMQFKNEQGVVASHEQEFYDNMAKEMPKGANGTIFKIKVISWNAFSIGDVSRFTPYEGNGLCKNIKMPKKVSFEPMNECSKDFDKYLDPGVGIYDFQKMGDNWTIFFCFQVLGEYKHRQKTTPSNWNNQDSKLFLKIAEQLLTPYNKSADEAKQALAFARKFSLICESQLPTIGAYFGGLVAQQVIKGLTNKYTPIKQFFTFHFSELNHEIPEDEAQICKWHIPQDELFRNIKIVVGNTNMYKIQSVKAFMVGAGAIGCELLKNFGMVDLGSEGEIVVTDPDHIETSNLSRQFLFREKHVKKSKAATACATLIQMNPRLQGHIHARLDKVCEDTEEIYSNQFVKSRTLIANALDNVQARQYVDKRCVQNKVPLFESGTLGPKGHVQVIVPFKTENYGSQQDPNEEAQIPHCTLKMFPQETVHCIQWARDIFGKLFTLNPKALKKVIQAKNINVIEGQERTIVYKMIKYCPKCFDDCVAEAVRKFYVYFRDNVRQLLYTYPLDTKTKQGRPFWQLPKRPPKQISLLDIKDESHRTFIAAYAVLLAKTYAIPFPLNFRKSEGKEDIMEIAKSVKIEQFKPNAEQAKQIAKQVEKEATQSEETINSNVQPEAVESIELTQQILQLKIRPEEFEKDDDFNGHIDLIFAMSNLRSQNYGLNECAWIQAKLKAGKIMAALSTTTSVVAALQTIEIIKLAIGSQTWRNAFLNLAVSIINITEPGPPAKHKIGNTQFTVWEQWKFTASTLGKLLNEINNKYKVQAYNVSTIDGKPVYWEAIYKDKQELKQQLLNKSLKSMFDENTVELNISMRDPATGMNYENVPKVIVEISKQQ